MIHLDHLLEATSGTLLRMGRYTHFDTFNQDSRQLVPGELFVAVRGERSDGHDYLLDAVHRGASGLLIEGRVVAALTEEQRAAFEQAGVTTVVVEDTRIALQRFLTQPHEGTFLRRYLSSAAVLLHLDRHHQGALHVGREIAHALAAASRIA